jgi:hypothetical protein
MVIPRSYLLQLLEKSVFPPAAQNQDAKKVVFERFWKFVFEHPLMQNRRNHNGAAKPRPAFLIVARRRSGQLYCLLLCSARFAALCFFNNTPPKGELRGPFCRGRYFKGVCLAGWQMEKSGDDSFPYI